MSTFSDVAKVVVSTVAGVIVSRGSPIVHAAANTSAALAVPRMIVWRRVM
jgi:hypothetical protein